MYQDGRLDEWNMDRFYQIRSDNHSHCVATILTSSAVLMVIIPAVMRLFII